MNANMKFLFVYVLYFVLLLVHNYTSAADFHLMTIEEHFGPNGTDSYYLELENGMTSGSMIKVEARTSYRGTINICDGSSNYLLHFDNRLYKGKIKLASKWNHGKWIDYEQEFKNPTTKGEISVVTIIYMDDGFHVFVNGRKLTVYPHQINSKPMYITGTKNTIHKVLYVGDKEDEPPYTLPGAQK